MVLLCALVFSACAGAPKFPTSKIYETAFFVQDGQGVWVCGEYEIIDPLRRKYKYVQDHPIEKCIGVFGFEKRDIPKILDWSEDIEAYYKKKCGK